MSNIFNSALFIFVTYSLTFGSSQNHYCNLPNCNRKEMDTMCKFPESPSANDGQRYQLGLSQNDKNWILIVHNSPRYQVSIGNETRGNSGPQPAAATGVIKTLSWNNESETIARRWTNRCQAGRDACRNSPTIVVGLTASAWGIDPTRLLILCFLILEFRFVF